MGNYLLKMKFTIAIVALLCNLAAAERPVWGLRSVNDHRTDAGIQKQYGDASVAAANARNPQTSSLLQLESDSSDSDSSDDDLMQTADYMPGQSGKLGGGVYDRVIPTRFEGDLSPMVWSPMLYVFLSNAIPPSLNQPLYYFVSDELGISNEFLSSAETVMWGMMLLGSAIAPYVLNEKTSYSSSFFWGSFALMLCTLNTLALVTRANVRVGLPDRLFMLGSDSVETLISRIMMLPFLTLAAKLTPEGMEATCFALFMSVNNFGYQVAGFSGSYLTAYLEIGNGNFGNLWIAVLVRAVLMLIPMALVHRMVPKTVQRAATKDTGFDKST